MYPLETWKPEGYVGPPDQKAGSRLPPSDQGTDVGRVYRRRRRSHGQNPLVGPDVLRTPRRPHLYPNMDSPLRHVQRLEQPLGPSPKTGAARGPSLAPPTCADRSARPYPCRTVESPPSTTSATSRRASTSPSPKTLRPSTSKTRSSSSTQAPRPPSALPSPKTSLPSICRSPSASPAASSLTDGTIMTYFWCTVGGITHTRGSASAPAERSRQPHDHLPRIRRRPLRLWRRRYASRAHSWCRTCSPTFPASSQRRPPRRRAWTPPSDTPSPSRSRLDSTSSATASGAGTPTPTSSPTSQPASPPTSAMEPRRWGISIIEPMEIVNPGLIAQEARFLVDSTDRLTKVCVPSPYLLGVRLWEEAVSTRAYPTRDEFIDALVPHTPRRAPHPPGHRRNRRPDRRTPPLRPRRPPPTATPSPTRATRWTSPPTRSTRYSTA